MALANESAMKAALTVLERATLTARMLGFEGSSGGLPEEKSAQLADLMDAVHNIPHLLTLWEICDEPRLISMLKEYDEKWDSSLADVYTRVRSGCAG